MGDWEDVYGAGADFDAIIDGYNADYFRESRALARRGRSRSTREAATSGIRFETFAEAAAWARSHPGKSVTRCPDGNGFIGK